MLLFSSGKLPYPESTFQPCPSRRFCEVWKQVYFSSLLAIRTTWYSVCTLINQQHPSERQDFLRPDIHQCLEAHQSSRRFQCSSASIGQNHFYVMLLLSQGCCFIQSLLFSYVLREDSVKFKRIYFGSLSAVRTMWYSVRTLISQQHPSGRRDLSVRTPISV
jgi:hypothetical protein